MADGQTPRSGRRGGIVSEFDDARGLGAVTEPDGSSWPFHCTAIAGGSRTIPVGTPVYFSLAAGYLGRWEAADLRAGE